MKKFMIGEAARRSGVPASAIRYYESMGVLPRPERVGGRRWYDESVVSMLHLVAAAKRAGFAVKEIRRLTCGRSAGTSLSAHWKTMAGKKLEELDAVIARAEAMKRVVRAGMLCRCVDLSQCELLAVENI